MNGIITVVILILLIMIGYYIYKKHTPQPRPMAFDGSGYTTFAAGTDYNTTTTDFSCDVKTSTANGLVLYGKADDEDMFLISIDPSGAVATQINTGSGVVEIKSTTLVNDNAWHHISLARDGQHIILMVDQEAIRGNIGGMTGITRPNIIYIGGSNLDISDDIPGFVGCIKNIKFNHRLAKEIEFDLTIPGVSSGCQ